MKNELEQLEAKEEDIDYGYGFNFLRRYGTSCKYLEKLLANKININTANDGQKDFVLNLMKGYNLSSLFNETKLKFRSEEFV